MPAHSYERLAKDNAVGSTAVYICVRKALINVRKQAGRRSRRKQRNADALSMDRAATKSTRGRPRNEVATERAVGSPAVYLCVRNAIKAVKKKRHYAAYVKERRLSTAWHAAKDRLSTRIRMALSCTESGKTHTSEELLGASIDKVIDHLGRERWNKRQELDLEIEHIWPCALYDLERESEQFKCFNYRNLRLWPRIKNREKSSSPPDAELAKLVPVELRPIGY
jgi:hypothetical protein